MASTQLVVIRLAGEEYGVDALAVQGILRTKKFEIHKVPGLPKFIQGVINLRGQVNYIVNLGIKFGLQETEITDESKFVMLNIGDSVAGCIVDEVTDIVNLPPAFVANMNTRYLKGIGKVGDRMIIILNPEQMLFTTEEQEALIETQLS